MDPTSAKKQLIDKLPKIAQTASQFECLLHAKDFREKILELIASAKTRIYLVALYLQDDEAGRLILDALYAAKQNNPALDIKVLVDWHRAQRGLIGAEKSDGNAALYRQYAESHRYNIEILGVPIHNKEMFGVLHLKGFVIDETVIYSGASLNDVYLAQQDNYRFDRYHVFNNKFLADCMADYIYDTLVTSHAVNSLTQLIRPKVRELKPAIRHLRNRLQKTQYQFPAQQINDDQIGLTPLVGLGKSKNNLNTQICNLIASAEKELIICTPYFNPPRLVSKEIRRALRRGVQISIVIGDKTANDFFIPPDKPFKTISALPYLYEMNLRSFAKRNEGAIAKRQLKIHLWRHERNSFHLKGMWVDDNYALITGNNLNPRAWKLDLENAILVHDKNQLLRKDFQCELDNIFQHTQLIGSYKQIDALESYPPAVKKLLRRIKRLKADHLLNQIL